MRTPPTLTFAFVAIIGFMLAGVAPAQCPRQTIVSPSDHARSFGRVRHNDRHLLIADNSEHSLCGSPFCANGMVYAYERDADGQWVLRQTIAPSDLAPSFLFGSSIALDGDRVLVSASRMGSGGPAIYEFVYDGEAWQEVGMFASPDTRPTGGVGRLRGDTALVVYNYDGVFVFEHIEGAWQATHDLRNPDKPVGRSGYGSGQAMSDEWIVIGAISEDILAPNGGAAYVYRRLPGGGLEYTQKLVAPDVLEGPRFGSDIEIQGDELFISARLSDRDFTSQGVVHVYRLRDGRWEPAQEITHAQPEDGDQFGTALSIYGDRLAIYAYGDITPERGRGVNYIFERDGDGRWVQAASVYSAEPTYPYGGGTLWGDTLAVGSIDALVGGEPTGAVDVFDLACLLCPADLDADGALTVFDFLLFFNLFDAGSSEADFDGDGELTIFDFLAFQTAFDAGCA
ncbi:MAG: hypothetical protein KIT54_07660 [Phycisphaeraceae bacterium]|nr:hypothetical protein [Phycisphaeraceae bacterium]